MKHRLLSIASAAVLTLAWCGAVAQQLDCMIQPHEVVQLGSPTPGVVERILVERGDLVERGQVVAQLKADVERASLGLARARAAQAGELAAAQSSREFASRELKRASDLQARNFVSSNYLDKQKTELDVAQGRTDQAREKRTVANKEVELAQAQLNLRTVRTPIAGVVVDRFKASGEYVDDKPMLRIARIDLLRVDVLVPAAAFGQVHPGMKGVVTPELLDPKEHTAIVKHVDRVIDAASNTFRVRLELPNPASSVPAGLRCKVDLGVKLPEPVKAAARAGNAFSAQPNADRSAASAAQPYSTRAAPR